MEDALKQCSMCQEWKPTDAYYIKIKKTGRLMSWCKACHRLRTTEWQETHKDRVREVAKNWRAANPEKANATTARYRERHPDRTKESQRASDAKRKERKVVYRQETAAHIKEHNAEYRQKNHATIRAQDAIYREQNQTALRERSAQWRKEHPERVKEIVGAAYLKNRDKKLAYSKRRRQTHAGYYLARRHVRIARIAGNGGEHTHEEWEALKVKYAYRCLRCGKQEPDIQLTRDHVVPVTSGGSNAIDNIQPLCLPCNSWKRAQTIDYRKEPFHARE